MLPQAEKSSDSELLKAAIEADTRAWATRLAFESLRGWRWPYWMNAQTNPASGNCSTGPHQPLMFNECARDVRPVVQSDPGRFAGSFDPRGMFTPPGQDFSIEAWFRIGKKVVVPSMIFDSSRVHFQNEAGGVSFGLNALGYHLKLLAVPKTLDGFDFVSLGISLTHDGTETESAELSPPVLYVAIRPYTVNSIAPVHDLVYNSKGFWMSENKIIALFPRRPDISWASDAMHGDAGMFVLAPPERTTVRCPAGMATAISTFHLSPETGQVAPVECVLPISPVYPREVAFHLFVKSETGRKSTIVAGSPQVDSATSEASDALLASSLEQLIAATDVTVPAIQEILLQRNHWIVAATRALHASGHQQLATRLLNYCALGLGRNGYLPHSHGRWGFAGQFLTALADNYRISGQPIDTRILRYSQVKAIGRWIARKRREISYAPKKPAGLFPPGLTRNGIGQEYQLVDNIWGIEGLVAASWLARQFDEHANAEAFHAEAVKFAAQVNAAIHRELEYGIMQRVPGRLHRAFDPTSATELFDLALTHEARALLSPVDRWLSQVMDEVTEPLDANIKSGPKTPQLYLMDARGISPSRHLMRALLVEELDKTHPIAPGAFDTYTTASGVWPEYLDLATGNGRGILNFDPEAAALYVLLSRKLKDTANNRDS